MHHRLVVSAAEWRAKDPQSGSREAAANGASRSVPATATPLTADALLASMPAVSGLVCAWIAALQAGVAYLVVSRIHSEHSHFQSHAMTKSLKQARDLLRTRDAIIFGLAKLAESRDYDTGQHLERIAHYSTRLAAALQQDPKFQRQISSAFVQSIGISSALHDIGKVGIADSILLKPGRLDDDERLKMQLHAMLGADCIRDVEQRLGTSNFLRMAREIALCHHERWDGTGYPDGLMGAEIPLSARIVAVADVYDALYSTRIYKPRYSHEKCVAIIREGAGKQFDPDVVEAFLKIESQFRLIARQFSDEGRHVPEDGSALLPDETAEGLTAEQERILAATFEHDHSSHTLHDREVATARS